MRVKNSAFVVSGGASGLGAATVRRLCADGGSAVIADTNPQAGQALAEELGGSARFVRCDVTREDDVRSAVEAAVKDFGGIRGAINCAGIALAEKVLGKERPHDLQRFARVLQVNVVGTFNLLRQAAERIAAQPADVDGERGVLINTASIAAFDGQIGQAAYAASKGAIVAMTLPIARELARHGIRCVTIAPGIFATPMMTGLPAEAQESLGKSVPFPPRLGRPQEFAALVAHIIENAMLNGETIRLDGALRMAPR